MLIQDLYAEFEEPGVGIVLDELDAEVFKLGEYVLGPEDGG
jgi:hypothetical protein